MQLWTRKRLKLRGSQEYIFNEKSRFGRLIIGKNIKGADEKSKKDFFIELKHRIYI